MEEAFPAAGQIQLGATLLRAIPEQRPITSGDPGQRHDSRTNSVAAAGSFHLMPLQIPGQSSAPGQGLVQRV